jgi:hypothetical protein
MSGKGKNKNPDSQQSSPQENPAPSRLRELCGPNDEMYSALSRLLLLDPIKIVSPLDSILTEAQDNESKGNKLKAEVGYRVAGGLSLWKADTDGVRRYFTKASTFDGPSRSVYTFLAQRADEAVGIAKRFYEIPTPP